nr:SulP family inorganic anion transporter [Arthrobacter sp. KBS0703]
MARKISSGWPACRDAGGGLDLNRPRFSATNSRPPLLTLPKSGLRWDLPASLVVFLVAVPLSLGIAAASGAPVMAGLIAAAVGGIVAVSYTHLDVYKRQAPDSAWPSPRTRSPASAPSPPTTPSRWNAPC